MGNFILFYNSMRVRKPIRVHELPVCEITVFSIIFFLNSELKKKRIKSILESINSTLENIQKQPKD